MPNTLNQIMNDPATSHWLKNALERGLTRDLVDALEDAAILHAVFEENFSLVLADSSSDLGQR